MKKHITIYLITIFYTTLIFAQNTPPGIAYQAVAIKDGAHSLGGQNASTFNWSSKDIQVRFSIFDQYPGGSVQYSEVHSTKTDEFGVFNLIIGQGKIISGIFDNIPWELGTAHLQVEIDFENNNNFKVTSFERFWSVPYAFVTKKTKGLNTDSAISSLNNKFTYLKNRDKDTVIGNEGGISYKSLDSLNKALKAQIAELKLADKDTVIGNEWQNLSMKKDSLLISNGKGIKLLDNDSLNEIQKLTRVKDTVSLSKNGGKFVLNDDDPKNELQDLTLVNDSIGLTKSTQKISLNNFSSSTFSQTGDTNSYILLAQSPKFKTICSTITVNNFGLGIPELITNIEIGDSIYYIGFYYTSAYAPFTKGEFIISRSKKNCGSNLIFKTINTTYFPQPNVYGEYSGQYKSSCYFLTGDGTDAFVTKLTLPNFQIVKTKLKLPLAPSMAPYSQPSGGISKNLQFLSMSAAFKDTMYLIYSNMYANSGGTYYGTNRFYKYSANTGDLYKIDSTSDIGIFGNAPNQTTGNFQQNDSVIYKSDPVNQKLWVFNLYNRSSQVIWDNPNKYPNQYFTNIYFNFHFLYFPINKRILIHENSSLNSPAIIYDLNSKKDVYDLNWYKTLSNIWFYRLRNKGINKLYLVSSDWNSPISYIEEPILRFFK